MAPATEKGRDYVSKLQPNEKPQLIRWQKVEPRVPLYITYYTLFPVPGGTLTVYPDVYGYDKVLADALETYMK
jgi:murein L,D-transpeptidase YcbB/YkuD